MGTSHRRTSRALQGSEIRAQTLQPATEPTGRVEALPSRRVRVLASIAICLHLLAVFSAPWSAPPPSSELSQAVAGWFLPYVKAIAMDNGYRFFCPDPGPSHILRYEYVTKEGTTTPGQIPDLSQHRPRLLYHRHFMISEMVYTLSYRTLDGENFKDAPPEIKYEIESSQRLAKLLIHGVVRSLFAEHPEADVIRLFLQTHGIPSPLDLQRGAKLTDPEGYLPPIPLGEFQRGDL